MLTVFATPGDAAMSCVSRIALVEAAAGWVGVASREAERCASDAVAVEAWELRGLVANAVEVARVAVERGMFGVGAAAVLVEWEVQVGVSAGAPCSGAPVQVALAGAPVPMKREHRCFEPCSDSRENSGPRSIKVAEGKICVVC